MTRARAHARAPRTRTRTRTYYLLFDLILFSHLEIEEVETTKLVVDKSMY